MTRAEVDKYIKENTGESPEVKLVNDTVFVKFDNLPYAIRDCVFQQEDYDKTKMISLPRDCGCGTAFFIEGNHFYNLTERFVI